MAKSQVDNQVYSDGDTFDLLAIFHGGWYGEKPNCSVSGCGSQFPSKYAREGSIIVDGSHLDYGIVCDFTIRGPMRDLRLPANTYRSLFGAHPQSAEGLTYADFRSLDSVSLDVWLAEARNLGARLGVFTNGAVRWYAGPNPSEDYTAAEENCLANHPSHCECA